jgi:predicted outer membrane protein
MTAKIPFALLIALVSTTAVAQSTGEKTGVNSALGVAPTTADFVTEAAVSDMTEIAAAQIALQKGGCRRKAVCRPDGARPHQDQRRIERDCI